MKAHVAWLMLAVSGAVLAAPPPIESRLEHYRCTICHAERDWLAGPAWADVAQHYRGDRHAQQVVADRIRAGMHNGTLWHMPPHPEVSPADADAMAKYILAVPD
jgi:cytochrome c551/c552